MKDHIFNKSDYPVSLENLQKMVKKLREPDDYFSGTGRRREIRPENVLFFSRTGSRLFRAKTPAFHHRFVLIIALEGSGGVIVDDGFLNLAAGRSLLIFPHQAHYFAADVKQKMNWLFITFEMDEPDQLENLRNSVAVLRPDGYVHVFHALEDFISSPEKNAEKICARLTLALAELRPEKNSVKKIGVKPSGERRPDVIRQAAGFISKNPDQPISVSDVAGKLGYSASHLRRIFRQSLGVSLGAFIRERRIHHACALLRNTDEPVSAVAEAAGFSSVYAFSRAFKNHTGLTPSAYRRQPLP